MWGILDPCYLMEGQSVEVSIMVKDVTKGQTSGGDKEKGLLLKVTAGAMLARWPRWLTVHP